MKKSTALVATLPLLIPVLLYFILHRKPEGLEQHLFRHVAYLASDELRGRLRTTKGDTLAREYIQKYLKKSGIAPQSQAFDYLLEIKAKSEFIVITPEADDTLACDRDYVVKSESGSDSVRTEVVFIGFGIHDPESGYDDFKQIDLTGKIVLCYLHLPLEMDASVREMVRKTTWRERISLAQACGAKAVIFLAPQNREVKLTPLHEYGRFSQTSVQYQIPVLQMSNAAIASIMSRAGVDITAVEKRLQSSSQSAAFTLPRTLMNLKVETRYLSKNVYNILAMVRGTDTTRTLVIGAHYDHIGVQATPGVLDSIMNGADDNASGVAVLLELARHYTERPQPPCNLLFAFFGAEESGLKGSKYFLTHIPQGVNQIKAMINLDMLGRMRDSLVYLDFKKTDGRWQEIVDGVPHDSLRFSHAKIDGRSDATSFAVMDIPSLWIFTGMHEDLHQVSDEIDKINFRGMQQIMKFTSDIIDIVSRPEILFYPTGRNKRLNEQNAVSDARLNRN